MKLLDGLFFQTRTTSIGERFNESTNYRTVSSIERVFIEINIIPFCRAIDFERQRENELRRQFQSIIHNVSIFL